MRMGSLTDPLATQVAKSPEERHEPIRMVWFSGLAMVAEAGTASIDTALRPTASMIALPTLSLFTWSSRYRLVILLAPDAATPVTRTQGHTFVALSVPRSKSRQIERPATLKGMRHRD